jgi:hypothetical protein
MPIQFKHHDGFAYAPLKPRNKVQDKTMPQSVQKVLTKVNVYAVGQVHCADRAAVRR